MKAFGKNIKKENAPKLTSDISKAESKFTKGFDNADLKGGCPTIGDSGTIEEKVNGLVQDTLCDLLGGCVRAREITDPDDCVDGPLSDCRVGDYLLENDAIRVVVQDVGRNIYDIGTLGGQIIDADLRRGPGEDEIDNFKEWSTSINVENTAHYTGISIINDGVDGNPAVIRVTGPDDLLDYLNPSTVVTSFGFAFPSSADDRDLPIEVSTDYILEPGKNYVRVETTLQNTDPGNSVSFFFGDFLNGAGQLENFLPGYGLGQPLITTRCPDTAPNPCNALAYRGFGDAARVSYGYVHDVPRTTVFNTSMITVSVLGREILNVLLGVQPPNYTLQPMGQVGDNLTITRYFVVGDGTASSILNARNEIQGITTGTLKGIVETVSGGPAPGAEVAVLGEVAEGPSLLGLLQKNVVSHTVTDASGAFSLTLPPPSPGKNYRVVANLEGHPYEGGGSTPVEHPFTITAGVDTDLGTITLPDSGALQVNVTDGSANPLPAKVSVVGFDPSPDPLNKQSLIGVINNTTGIFRDRDQDGLPFGLAQALFVDPSGSSDVVPLEPGDYQVVVSRGPEYSIDSQAITVTANATKTVSAKIAPVVDTDGFLSCEFHIHSLRSHDSVVTQYERMLTVMSEKVDFFTPNEHEFRSDFQPIIDAAGWGNLVASVGSQEITTFDYGHFNAWPLTIDPAQVNGGAVDHGGAAPAGQDFPSSGNYNLTPGEVIALTRTDPAAGTVQINHIHSHFGFERGGSDLGSGLVIDTGLEPPKSAIPPSTRRLDPAKEDPETGYFTDEFDALELWNGSGRGDIVSTFLAQNAGDWFNLLNQGIVGTGTAVSDAHKRLKSQAGIPRTMVASLDDNDLPQLDPNDASAAVNAGKAIGTNTPMVRVTLEALTGGQTASLEYGTPTLVSAADGKVEVTVEIQSPVWAEFDTVEYYLNSTTIQSITTGIETGAGTVDLPRYGISPDFVDTPTVSTVVVNPSVPGGSRLVATSTLTLDGISEPALTEDTWIIVMVKGTDGVSKPLFPAIPNSLKTSTNSTLADLIDGNLGEDGTLALAFTNPLFVDVNDGGAGGPDGDYDPPGVSYVPAP